MTPKKRFLIFIFFALGCAWFLNGFVLKTDVSAMTKYNWPKKEKVAWKIKKINSGQVKKVVRFKNIPGGYYVQGGTVTEKYYVFTVYLSDYSPNNYIYVANRSNGKIVKKIRGNWWHMGAAYYKWGSNHVRIKAGSKSKDGCLDLGKMKMIGVSKCKTKRASNYGAMKLTHQGDAATSKYVLATGWDAARSDWGQRYTFHKHENAVFIYNKKGKIQRTLYIPRGVIYGEIEDVSVDNEGNVYLFYNFCHVAAGGASFYKINKKDVGIDLVSGSSSSGGGHSGGGSSTGKPGQSGSEGSSPIKVEPDKEAECASILKVFCDDAKTDGEKAVNDIIRFVISMMTIGISVLGTIGIIFCGYLIMTARDNEAQVSKAKKRMIEIVIGILVWVLAGALLSLLLPTDESTIDEALTSSRIESDFYDKM